MNKLSLGVCFHAFLANFRKSYQQNVGDIIKSYIFATPIQKQHRTSEWDKAKLPM